MHLRVKGGFVDLFNHTLKECESVPEFDFCWNKLIETYNCGDNSWIKRLYNTRHNWCPVFSKHSFSAGILSSQRSETTNHYVSKRMHSTASLCEFYDIFSAVVSEWRSKENGEDYHCLNGIVEMSLRHVGLLNYVVSKYTIQVYKIFEREFKLCTTLHQGLLEREESHVTYKVWNPSDPRFFLIVVCGTNSLTCTCGKFTEVGILCSYILRVLHVSCVEEIPDTYILGRWCKDAAVEPDTVENNLIKKNVTCPSIWRTLMIRKAAVLISAAKDKATARAVVEELMKTSKLAVEKEVGSIFYESGDDKEDTYAEIGNPAKKQKDRRQECEEEKYFGESMQYSSRKENKTTRGTTRIRSEKGKHQCKLS